MKRVHCDGCGFTEPEDLAKSKKQIQEVTLMMVKDPRFPEGTDKHDADLCDDCIGRLLHTYFRIGAGGQLDTPAFIGPRKLEPTPESRRADA